MKQAVILIHGIGEQKPMDTVRGFVKSVLKAKTPGQELYWSKSDPLSGLFELRRLQSRGGRGSTHFYEYYWAYKVESTSLIDVGLWLGSLVLRRPSDVPPSAKMLVWLSRLSMAWLLLLVGTGVISAWIAWAESVSPGSWPWMVGALAWLLAQGFFVYYLGDAARYLSPRPQNIRLRRAIRSDGARLLKALHKRNEYERIIVVGHSLGSVIGYDILNAFWQKCHHKLPGLGRADTKSFVRGAMKGDGVQPVFRNVLSKVGDGLKEDSDDAARKAYQDAQLMAQLELRRLGHPWRVTDFVTLGSPLVHAMLLIARNADEFEERKRQRELTTCPPQRDAKGYGYSSPVPYDVGQGKKFTPLVPHQAAPFAVTRWTNLYAPARFGLFGDFVGGPLGGALGWGINDIAVHVNGWRGYTLLAHTRYWRAAPAGARPHPTRPDSLTALRAALALQSLRRLRRDSRASAAAPGGAAEAPPAGDGGEPQGAPPESPAASPETESEDGGPTGVPAR